MTPIEGDVPVGADVRTAGPGSELYLSIKDERSSARSAEREALASPDPDVDPLVAGIRSWREVSQQGTELLIHHAKDLQVAAWLTEAWLRTDGLAGLANGFTLLADLVLTYWDQGLYPLEDEDGVEARLTPLFGLFGREEPGTLIQPIKLLPLTDTGQELVALWTIEAIRAQSIRHDDPEVRDELTARRDQRIAQLDAAIAGASRAFIADNLTAIDEALAAVDRLMEALDQRTPYGRFGSQVAAPLLNIAEILRRHHIPPEAETSDQVAEAEDDMAAPGVVGSASGTPAKQNVNDRQAAFATLLEIAGFFERTEPQSLIGHSLRDLVRRASLPLDDLLAELLPDREQRSMFLLRAGVRPDAGSGGGDSFNSF
ncbi:type VI secretion system protein TssA [Sphingomonas sp.]|uniref:type VI secretion system protein TssA n=1 Tax=Sphingomonas sp. TaxID=28214 RepID=UPI003B3ADE02